MANFTITVSNQLTLIGGSLPTYWGNTGPTTMTWGTSLWGDSAAIPQDVGKLVTDILASDSAISTKVFDHYVKTDTLVLTSVISDLALTLSISIANSLTLSSDVVTEYLTNGVWYKVFPGASTNASDRITTSYASGGAGSGSYSNVTNPSTVWS